MCTDTLVICGNDSGVLGLLSLLLRNIQVKRHGTCWWSWRREDTCKPWIILGRKLVLGNKMKFENQLANLEMLFTISKVQFSKDRYKIVPVTQNNPKCNC